MLTPYRSPIIASLHARIRALIFHMGVDAPLRFAQGVPSPAYAFTLGRINFPPQETPWQ